MNRCKTIVIGGGAAGLMAAGRAAQTGSETILLEKMARTGRKIGISGKGRCNLTNTAELTDFIAHFGNNGRFLRQAFQHFFSPDLIDFFSQRDLPLITERGGRIFPESGRALDVVKVFNDWLKNEKVQIKKSSPVSTIFHENGKVSGLLVKGEQLECNNIILATGGMSYPRTGSTGDGYRLAESLGHTVTPLRPALVPLDCSDTKIRRLAGLDLRNVEVCIIINGKRKKKEFGELTFTETGVSGPVILKSSTVIVDALDACMTVALSIDLKPALDIKKLDNRVIRDLTRRRGEAIDSILRGIMPIQLIPLCLNSCAIPTNIDTTLFPAKLRKRLVQWLKNFRFDINNYRSFEEAIITAGGVHLREIDPRTMESKIIKGLFIAGELLDLQADTGGYNLQAAFSTGWLAGSSVY